MAPNVTALAMGAAYTGVFWKYAAMPMTMYLGAGAAGLAATYGIVAALPVDQALNVLGYLGVGMVIVMFGGPLATIKTVVEEKSTASLPFAFTLASFANCITWTGYGALVIHDAFIWFPNALGLASACAQLGLFAKYGFAKSADDDAETKAD